VSKAIAFSRTTLCACSTAGRAQIFKFSTESEKLFGK